MSATAQWPPFEIHESLEPNGTVGLALFGELDLAVAGRLEDRLGRLREQGRRVRLDLSGVDFIDSSGVQAVIAQLRTAHRERWSLELEPHVTPSVRRVIETLELAAFFWPANSG